MPIAIVQPALQYAFDFGYQAILAQIGLFACNFLGNVASFQIVHLAAFPATNSLKKRVRARTG
jgi:hypothetical protein